MLFYKMELPKVKLRRQAEIDKFGRYLKWGLESKKRRKALLTWSKRSACVTMTKMILLYLFVSTQGKFETSARVVDDDFFLGERFDRKMNQIGSKAEARCLDKMKNKMEDKNIFNDTLSDDDIWTERFANLDAYGKVNNLTGGFEFLKCSLCSSLDCT